MSAGVWDPVARAVVSGADVDRDIYLDCDVVVVGSGAGGGVTAAELAEGGLDVIVLEEGGHYGTDSYDYDPGTAAKTLYRNAGASIIWGRPNIIFAEGRCLGGSTVVNGGLAWRTPERIIKRWNWEAGVEDMTPAKLEPIFERIEQRANVSYGREDSIGPDALLIHEGATKLGYDPIKVRRNAKDCVGTDNCAFGCPAGAKQSTLLSYIPRAVQHGARIYTNVRVQKIITDRRRATGVHGTITDPFTGRQFRCTVRAKAVVSACGALETPVLISRSGLCRQSRKLGRNFLCHPNGKAVAIYPDEIRGWEGSHQYWQIHDFIDEGIIFGCTFVPPSLIAGSLPYIGAESWQVMQNIDRMVMAAVLVEDTQSGRIFRGPGGEAFPWYQMAKRDIWLLKRGVALLAEIYFESGAEKVIAPFAGFPILESVDDVKKIFEYRIKPQDIEVLTVHAMGTAQMGKDPKRSVVDSFGEAHDVKGLFVSDASLFPTGLGVNPQITVMALATRNAYRLLERWSEYR